MALMIRGSNPSSVFNLCVSDENSATYALGWVLERSLNFRSNMIRAWLGKQMSVSDTVISLQNMVTMVVTLILKFMPVPNFT